MNPKHHLLFGVLLSILSFFSLATGSSLVKLLDSKIPVFQILFLQTMIGVIGMPLFFAWTKKKLSYCKSNHYGLLIARSAISIGAFCFMYVSIGYVSVTNATLLLNTAPLFIPLILLCFFREKIDHRLWAGIIPGFIGIVLILHPGENIFQPQALLSLISGACMGSLYIVIRQLHVRKEPMPRVLLYLFVCAAVLTFPFAFYSWVQPSSVQWILLFFISLCSFLAQSLVTLSLRYGTTGALAPLCYSSVIFSLFYDWFLWKHVPSWVSFLGIFLVIIGGIVALLLESRLKKVQ